MVGCGGRSWRASTVCKFALRCQEGFVSMRLECWISDVTGGSDLVWGGLCVGGRGVRRQEVGSLWDAPLWFNRCFQSLSLKMTCPEGLTWCGRLRWADVACVDRR